MNITEYTLYQGKDEERLQVFIRVEEVTLEEADAQLKILSNALKTKMTKNWKCLPSLTLPEDYNIVSLPYKPL
jgi:hypothetical protein